MISIRTAERPGAGRPTEDRIFTTENAVIVLDGAAQPEHAIRDGGWLADTLVVLCHFRVVDDDRCDLILVLSSNGYRCCTTSR
jgi:hypothetical protein